MASSTSGGTCVSKALKERLPLRLQLPQRVFWVRMEILPTVTPTIGAYTRTRSGISRRASAIIAAFSAGVNRPAASARAETAAVLARCASIQSARASTNCRMRRSECRCGARTRSCPSGRISIASVRRRLRMTVARSK